MKVCQAFAQLGHAVTLLVPANKEPQPVWEMLADHYGIKTFFEIRSLPMTTFMKRRDFLWRAVRTAHKLKGDLVYARSVSPAVLGLLFNMPVILEMHQLPSGTFGSTWFRLFLWLGSRKRLVPITHALAHNLQKQYHMSLTSEQVVVAPSGVDLERFANLPDPVSARRQLQLPEGWTAVCTGHLYAGRGLDLVMNLAGRMPKTNFLWVGGSSKDVETGRDLVDKAGLKNMNLVGFVPNSKLPLFQAAADALLIPYTAGFTNSGGEDISAVSSPMKIFEYMASGRVIISSDLPVLHEVLNEKNAIFCPTDNVDAWERTLHDLQINPQAGQQLADQARMDAGKYSWLERSRLILANFKEERQ